MHLHIKCSWIWLDNFASMLYIITKNCVFAENQRYFDNIISKNTAKQFCNTFIYVRPIGYRAKIVGPTHFLKCCWQATALNIYNPQHTNISTLSRYHYKPVLFYTELYPVSVLNFLTARALHITDGWTGTYMHTDFITEEKNLHHRDMHKMLVPMWAPYQTQLLMWSTRGLSVAGSRIKHLTC